MSRTQSAPVLAILIGREDGSWLDSARSAVDGGSAAARRVVVVDPDSDVDGDRASLVSDALLRAADESDAASDDIGDWAWVLGEADGLVPDRDCLAELLAAADAEPDLGVLLPRSDGSVGEQFRSAASAGAYPAEQPGALIRVTWEDEAAEEDAGEGDDAGTEGDTDETVASVPAARLIPAVEDGDQSPVSHELPQEARSSEARSSGLPWWRTRVVPPLVLGLALAAVSLIVHGLLSDRLGWNLAGGVLLPMGDLGQVWSEYLASWHGVSGGTTSAASPAIAVLGVLGVAGGPEVAVSLLLLLDLPLAALVAYAATRRMRLGRWVRAGGAAAYALIPAATDAVAAGRLDAVVVHIAAPAVAAGLISLLTRPDVRWLPMSALCALGLALLGAFSPITYAVAVAGLLAAFVALPPPPGRTGRGIPALVLVVLLPLALLMPWLPTLVTHPALLLHGITGPADPAGVTGLLGLHPSGGVPLGIAVLLAAIVAAVLVPGKHLVAGLVLTVLGVAGVAVTQLVHVPPLTGGAAAPGYAGAPLLVVGMGLVAIVLGAISGSARTRSSGSGPGVVRGAVAGGALTLVVLVVAVSFASTGEQPRGDVHAGGGVRLTADLEAELADNGRGVLVLGHGQHPDRLAAARTPRLGDDALAPVGGMAERLEGWRYGLLAGSRDAVTDAAAAGVLLVVLPPGEDGSALSDDAGDLVQEAPATSDGRTVLRLTPESGQVTLVSPEQAHRAVSGGAPSDELMRGEAIAPVAARLPEARVRVSDGPEGRLLVLAAEQEPGWTATVDGEAVPITPAWGHQVAVSVPEESSEVVVRYSSAAHGVFLLGSVAALLFTVLTAVPGRRRRS